MNTADFRKVYLRQVRRKLHCPGGDKRRLLAGLEAELADRFEQPPSQLTAIAAQFGAPEEMAAELESTLPRGAVERYLKRQRLLCWLGVVAGVAAAAILIWYIIWIANHDVSYTVKEITVVGG